VTEAETAVPEAAAVPATKAAKPVGGSRGRGKCSTAEGDRRDEREADLSQHDMYSSLDADARFAHPALFVRQPLRAVHVSALLQIASADVDWHAGRLKREQRRPRR
jgi:hypothetical protein